MSNYYPERGTLNRRSILKGGVVAVVAVGSGVGMIDLASRDASATATITGITASDVSISNGAGEITTFTIDPDITVDYSGFPRPVDSIQLKLFAGIQGNSLSRVFANAFATSSNSTSGSISPSLSELSLLTTNGGPIDPADFNDGTEGDGPAETTVEFRIEVGFRDADNTYMEVDGQTFASEVVTMTVSVTNETATVSFSGQLNTNAT